MQLLAATVTERGAAATGQPVCGSSTWPNRTPSRIKYRCESPLVAKAPRSSSRITDASRVASGRSMPTFQVPPGGARLARRSPPKLTKNGLGMGCSDQLVGSIHGIFLAESAEIQFHVPRHA